jgi:uncharacterized protein (TIGR02001 family)
MDLKSLLITCTGGALIGVSSLASAEHTLETGFLGDFTFSANVALTTDYVWRYASQTDEKGAIQGGFDVAHSTGLYAGAWGSNVDFRDGGSNIDSDSDPSMELDLYGGFAHEFDMGLGIDVGVINYRYPGAKLDWVEYFGGLSYTLWGVGLSGSVNYTDDVFNSDEDAFYYTAAAEYTFDIKFPVTISGDVGYYDLDDFADQNKKGNSRIQNDDYTGYRVGAAVDVKGFVFDVSYYNTLDNQDAEQALNVLDTNWTDGRLVATISTSF